MYLPRDFQPKKLVESSLHYSSLKQLWEDTKSLHNSKCLDLSHSKNLINMPNFSKAPNLECLNLEGCIKLREIHPCICTLRKLVDFSVKDCKSLLWLPNCILSLNSLEHLNISACSKLYNIPLFDERKNEEHSKKICISEAPSHSQSTSSFTKRWLTWPLLLNSRVPKESISCLLPSSPIFPCMSPLNLSFCNLVEIPDAIGNLSCLERLNLMGNSFATLPSLKELSKLYYLNLQHCQQLKYLPELPSRIELPSKGYMPFSPVITSLVPIKNEGLYMFNCPELAKRECYTGIGLSWMIQIVQV
ncbi:hypothetical protein VNO78_06286 [Psophocarpus tetragonolobus]|uniref:Uncharacterized protein n=1 Tax=Psophocarpus tetragonolobus TaxID=3891 RepID=A0AAN9SRX2_PSOTE